MLFSGCSIQEVHVKSLTTEEASKYSLTMEANTDIVCLTGRLRLITPKNTVFKPNDLANQMFYSREKGEMIKFPKDSLFLEIWNGGNFAVSTSIGYLVYPNGQFVYDNYNLVMITNNDYRGATIPNQLQVAECKYDGDILFTPIQK